MPSSPSSNHMLSRRAERDLGWGRWCGGEWESEREWVCVWEWEGKEDGAGEIEEHRVRVIESREYVWGREWQRLCNRLREVKEAKKSMQRAFQQKFMQIIFHEEYSSQNIPHLNFAAIAVVLTPMLRTCACVRVLLCAFILYFTSGILRTCVVLNCFVMG